MVNMNFDKFNSIQQKHKSRYIGGDKTQQQGINDHRYNDNQNSQKSPGATGRKFPL
ncbi:MULTISPECIES: hypothetical protein [unclassified Bacillus (in: firmicutes)]|uniref:hypothetical protein n=1 Tax=unclassified Bacillus (in: firmicutes) TaxID=185979 RepID=UPI00135B0494|nr:MULTISPECIES: hypothetical protein [unclassified Bacillus (in: firmicutes)]CAH0344337.1 hypothetical protein BCI9360_00587 [Bacillus sp. CECT 9360]